MIAPWAHNLNFAMHQVRAASAEGGGLHVVIDCNYWGDMNEEEADKTRHTNFLPLTPNPQPNPLGGRVGGGADFKPPTLRT